MSVARKYDIASRFYDTAKRFMERRLFSKFRERLFKLVPPRGRILEVGIGTGKNLSFYPKGVELVGVDVSAGMLKRCQEKVKELGLKNVQLRQMDVERLNFPDEHFDAVVSTFVFCTVPNPVRGLKEVHRVLKDGGRTYFLEHMRSEKWYLNVILGMMHACTKTLLGTSMLRKTRENIEKAGFIILHEENLLSDVVRLIVAEKKNEKCQDSTTSATGKKLS